MLNGSTQAGSPAAQSAGHVAGHIAGQIAHHTQAGIVVLEGIGKSFGQVRALTGIDFEFRAGECVGIAGHNGAGKSTLMSVLAGVFPPDQGELRIDGAIASAYDANAARAAGVRCVFQELSLCANLSVAENMCILHPSLRGRGWRRRATALMRAQLDAIFPGHGLKGHELVADLTLTQRQMVEIARGFTVVDDPARLVILDEPTSSLDAHTAEQLLVFIRKAAADGISTILISHMLREIERVADRVMVMRDGMLVDVLPSEGLTQDAIIRAMGQHVEVGHAPVRAASGADVVSEDLSARNAADHQADHQADHKADHQAGYQWTLGPGARLKIDARRGEVVGFAGLAGQGQTEALHAIYRAASRLGMPGRNAQGGVARGGVAFVAGDRARDGVFPLWSIAQNLDIRWLFGGADVRETHGASGAESMASEGRSRARRWLDADATRALVRAWRERIGIRGASMDAGILSLSGGNQQKVLFARALASDATLILMDDPTRGVDIGTKRDIYELIRAEASRGRTFVWYTTENDELAYCDRTYVFRSSRVTRVLRADECTEDALLAASFEEQAA